jgi:hypothetical protein
VQVRSSVWDLEDRFYGWLDSRYPRYRWVQNSLFERHRAYVMLLFGTEKPDGLSSRPTQSGGGQPWYVAACKGCRWESLHPDRDSAFAAAVKHSPHVRPDLLSADERTS